jgi:putative ABC transport system substrate-binding protein
MRWRTLLVLGLAALCFSGVQGGFAQVADKVYRLGVLSPGSGSVERMRRTTLPELARLGFSEGRNIVLEIRLGTRDQLPQLAEELAATRPDAVIAVSGSAIRAMRQAAAATPIVGAFIGEDPIAAGFAASLAHPGGTVTGIVMLAPELDAKRLYLLHEAVPAGRRIGALAVNTARDAPNTTAIKEAAERAGIELLVFYGAQSEDYPSAFAEMRRAGVDALEIVSAPELYTDASRLAALALETGLPTMCEWAEMARSGCLLGYGPDYIELQNSVANYVARIFRGAAPGELPIEGPTHYEFTVNLKTAKALGLSIPPSILARADEVIE